MSYRVSRSLFIAAPAQAIRPQLDTLRHWQQWSAWEQLDAAMQRTYSGPDSGVGAAYAWKGNSKAGQGRQLVDATSDQEVVVITTFIKPFKGENTSRFTLTPREGGTQVLWAMEGEQGPVMSTLTRLFSMDRMLAPQLEASLEGLKRVVEAR